MWHVFRWFQFYVIIKKAAKNIRVSVSQWPHAFLYLWELPRNENGGLYGKCMFRFLRNYQRFSKVSVLFCVLIRNTWVSNAHPSKHFQFRFGFFFFVFSHPSKCVVVSLFLIYILLMNILHAFIFHFYLILSEAFVQIFSNFLVVYFILTVEHKSTSWTLNMSFIDMHLQIYIPCIYQYAPISDLFWR